MHSRVDSLPSPSSTPTLYYGVRSLLHKRRWLLRLSQLLRACVILGPFKRLVLRRHRTAIRPRPLAVDRTAMFPDAPAAAAIHERLDRLGCAMLGELRGESVQRILAFCGSSPRTRHWNPHKACAEIDRLARNELIVDVARRYLDAEPILWLTQLKWTRPQGSPSGAAGSNGELPQYDSYSFHYDILDCRSVTLFVYLTDVDADSGPHVVVEGTNRDKTLADLFRLTRSDEAVEKKYGDRTKTILGRKGTAFFEDTSSLHKVAAGRKDRLILSIDYVIGRRPPPDRSAAAG